jgi:hypothetical protein
MNDNVSVEAGKVSIPPEVVWGVMVRIVEIDKLLRTGSNIAEVRGRVRKLLNASATELSGILMPEFDDLMAEAGVGQHSKKPDRRSGA